MPETRHDKNGDPYQLWTQQEWEVEQKAAAAAEAAAWPPELRYPDQANPTIEGMIKLWEIDAARARWQGAPGWRYWPDDRAFDNFRLWASWQIQTDRLPRSCWRSVIALPSFIATDGTVNLRGLAATVGVTVRTIKGHLSIIRELVPDLSQLRAWPHPLTAL